MRQHEDLGDVRPDFDEDGPMPLECDDCGRELQGARYRVHFAAILCDTCHDNRAEAADEAWQAALRNGCSPQTVAEQIRRPR